MTKSKVPQASGKRSLSSHSNDLSQPIPESTRRLTQLLDGPKKRRRVTETRPKASTKHNTASGGIVPPNTNARMEKTASAATTKRWSHLSSTVSKNPVGVIPGGLGRSALALAPGFKKSAKSSPAHARAVPAARKNEPKRKNLDDILTGTKGSERVVAREPIVKAIIPEKPTQNIASKENMGRNCRSKPSVATVGGNDDDDDDDDDEDDDLDITPMEQDQSSISMKPTVSLFARKVPRGSTRASSWTTHRPTTLTAVTALEGTQPPSRDTDPIATDDSLKAPTDTELRSDTLEPTVPFVPSVDIGMDTNSKADVGLVLDVLPEPPKQQPPKQHKPLRAISVLGPIPKPAPPEIDDTKLTLGDSKGGGGHWAVAKKHKTSAGNFVRLNLRNSAGACNGARKKTKKTKWQLQREERQQEWIKKREQNRTPSVGRGNSGPAPSQTGVDPLDDFMDGAFREPSSKKAAAKAAEGGASRDAIPKCPGHQQPCKILTVKKNSTGNKGRQFYACPMPRGEQCNHFQWADDTAEAAKRALLKNSSHSGFIARQVASYMERLNILTIPELRVVLTRHNLNTAGKKKELLARLCIWVRDEVADGSKELALEEMEIDDPKADSSIEEKEVEDPNPLPADDKDGDASIDETSKEKDVEDPNSLLTDEKHPLPADEKDGDASIDSSIEEPEIEDSNPLPADEEDGGASIGETSEEKIVKYPKPLPADEKDGDASIDETSDESDDDDDDDDSSASSEELELVREIQPGRKPPLSKEIECLMESEDESESCPNEKRLEQTKTCCPLRSTLQTLFGHSEFREGQEWTVRRCLEKKRTLLVAPTGFGKSLCYSLPSALMDGVCIVVSPLISLIQDQLRVLPPRLPAATLSGSISTANMAATIDDIVRGRLKVLFVSPERLTSSSFRRLFIPRWNPETKVKERHFPTVALLCVDEAHCMSQWAHNFRPSYLRMKTMMELIQPESVLAITATAGPRVVEDICRTLNISGSASESEAAAGAVQSDDSGVRVMNSDRDNIDVSCLILSNQEERLSKLIKLLTPAKRRAKGEHATEKGIEEGCLATGNVIVYVWRQLDAVAIAENLTASGVDGGVVVYHGGMDSGARSRSQSMFMRGKARICVATVAFGLGINKADVEGVIHMYLSASPEHYLQEIGRAGRDGRPAKAIALVLGEEVLVRHSLAHSDLISKSQIRNLLSLLTTNIKGSLLSLPKERPDLGPVNIALPLQTAIVHCDCKSETIETLVSLLEQKDYKESLVRMEGTIYDRATVSPKRRTLKDLATMEEIAKAILVSGKCVEAPAGETLAVESTPAPPSSGGRKVIGYSYGTYTFSVAECANHLGPTAEPRHVFAALRRLQNNGEIELNLDTTPNGRGVHMKLTREGMSVLYEGNDAVLDELATDIHDRFVSTCKFGTNKVLDLNNILQQVSKVTDSENQESATEKSASLQLFQKLIHEYFEAEGEGKSLTTNPEDLPDFSDVSARELSLDAGSVLSHLQEIQGSSEGPKPLQLDSPRHSDYASLAITKFLHGIAPLGTPLSVCRRHALFGRMQSVRFSVLQDAVTRLLGGYKTR